MKTLSSSARATTANKPDSKLPHDNSSGSFRQTDTRRTNVCMVRLRDVNSKLQFRPATATRLPKLSGNTFTHPPDTKQHSFWQKWKLIRDIVWPLPNCTAS